MNEYNSHAYVCGSRTDICEVCQMRVMLRDMENHGKNQCGLLPPAGLINPTPTRPPVLDLPPNPPPYSEVELDSAQGMDTPQWPNRLNPLDNENAPYVAVDADEEAFAEQETDPSAPLEIPEHAYNPRPANPTMVIDAAWLSSMKAVYGEDADLDAIVAQNMMMENLRQVTAHDDRPPPEGSSSRQRKPGKYRCLFTTVGNQQQSVQRKLCTVVLVKKVIS